MNKRLITINGETRSIRAWARAYGIKHSSVFGRMKRGMSLLEALTTPRRKGGIRLITHNGVTKSKCEWAREIGISPSALSTRLSRGMPLADALSTRPIKTTRLLTHEGVTKPLLHWARDAGIKFTTLHNRLRRGMSLAEALSTPNMKTPRLLTCNGVTKPLSDWAKDLGLTRQALCSRLKTLDIEQALTSPRIVRVRKSGPKVKVPASRRSVISFNGKEQTRLEWMRELGITQGTWSKMCQCGVSPVDILAEFHKTPGEVNNFDPTPRDRRGSHAQDLVKTENFHEQHPAYHPG